MAHQSICNTILNREGQDAPFFSKTEKNGIEFVNAWKKEKKKHSQEMPYGIIRTSLGNASKRWGGKGEKSLEKWQNVFCFKQQKNPPIVQKLFFFFISQNF